MRRTPLYPAHQALGARLIEFGGWEMPVQYTSIADEHLAVRNAAGVFDISHMGEVLIDGAEAARFLNHVLCNDIGRLVPGQGQYTLLCNERGGVVDDLYAYRLGDQEYLLIVNASRATTDFEWLQRQLADFAGARNVRLRDVSPDFGAIAIQGPKVAGFIDACFKGPSTSGTPVNSASELTKNECSQFNFGGTQVWLSRTGYTGEDGFEVVARSDVIEAIWNKVLEQGKPHGLKPAGLGARDTLRTEMCYPLYGHELDENTSPLEAGVGFFVALGKDNFIGKAALAAQKERGLAKKLAAFKMTGKAAPPRPDYAIWTGADPATLIGKVVSGTQSPSLSIGIGMGYVPPEFAKPGTPLQVEVRGKKFAAVVVAKPLYRKPG